MSIVSTLTLLLFFAGIYKIIPEVYHTALIIVAQGVLIPFAVSKVLGFFRLKKLSNVAVWFVLYLGAGIYSYYVGNLKLGLFLIGAVLNIFIQLIMGGKVTLIFPFKEERYTSKLTPFITAFLVIGSFIWVGYIYIEKLSLTMALALGGAIYLLVILNIPFFKRLKNVIFYIFKINVEDLQKAHKQETIRVLLSQISPIWSENKAVVSLQQLASSTWNEGKVEVDSIKWEFTRDEITAFYRDYIANKPKFRDDFKNTAGEMLQYLDKYGDCPSVVKEQSKAFGKYGAMDEKSTYDVLYKQNLIDHTLSICKLMFADSESGKINALKGINLEKMVLVALGHDLGKAVAYDKNQLKSYVTGDHPNTSVMVIETEFENFEKLEYKDEVMKMIKNHHGTPSAATPLLQDFKEYDSKARREYLKAYVKEQKHLNENDVADEKVEPAIATSSSIAPAPADDVKPVEKVEKAVEEPLKVEPVKEEPKAEPQPKQEPPKKTGGFVPTFSFTTDTEPKKDDVAEKDEEKELKPATSNNALYSDLDNSSEVPRSFIISDFFDIKEFLRETAEKINIINGGKFSYITVNGDMVLCYTGSIIFELKKLARLKKVKLPEDIKDNELGMSFTEYCRKLGILHTEWIQEGYFQGNFLLTDMDGNEIRNGRYIPLRAEAFKDYGTYADFETRKQGELENIINCKVATLSDMDKGNLDVY